MNAKKISTLLLVITVIALMVILAFRIRVGVTADSVAVLKTTGMTCGACSSSITKALESLKGVAAAEVDVEGGWVIVGYDTKAVKSDTLAEKVKSAGFSSTIDAVMTPEQFKQIAGRPFGQKAISGKGCCGGNGCGSNKQSL